METQSSSCDVLIVGLGPTGAVLANFLGAYGWNVIGLEREEDIYYAPRAVHFDDEAMRIFQAIDLDREITATSEAFTDMELHLRPNGKPALRLKIGSQDRRYGHAGAWWFHQPTLERHIHDGLRRYDTVHPYYGIEVKDLKQRSDHVEVSALTRDGQTLQFRARYVLGCDGARSFVRKTAQLPLETADFDEAWVVVDTKTRSGGKLPELPIHHNQTCDPDQPVTYVPLAGPYYEWQFMVTGDKSEREATDPQFVRQQLRSFVDLQTVDITRIAYYKFHGLWATRWRNGRIILAGDSAHQMPPFLGQGMCSGVRDAHALAWRMDLLLRGKTRIDILDDYERERRAHVCAIINGAMFLGRTVQTRNRLLALLRNTLVFAPARWFAPARALLYRFTNRKQPFISGFFGQQRKKLAGHLAIQPEIVDLAHGRRLLDEQFGADFGVLARRGALQGKQESLDALAKCIPVRLVEFDRQADQQINVRCVGDPEHRLQAWFDQHDIDFVIIRPDRYIFDAGRSQEFAVVAADLLRRLPSPEAARPALAVAA